MEKWALGDLCHQILLWAHGFELKHKSKVNGLKKFVQYVALFFWFDTFEGMPFLQKYFLAKREVLEFGWTLFPIHFLP